MDIVDAEKRIEDLKKRADRHKLARLKAEAARDTATDQLDSITKQLKEKYGISTITELTELLKEKENMVETLLTEAEEKLADV